MEKPPKKIRKIKIEFPKEIPKKPTPKQETNESNELEDLVQDQPTTIIKPTERISSSLELGEIGLENQVANAPESKTNNPDQKPLYETTKYITSIDSLNSDYQSGNYNAPTNFSQLTPPPSVSMEFSSQQDFSRNPLTGFRQTNPLEPAGYPNLPERNYESTNPNEGKKRRRM